MQRGTLRLVAAALATAACLVETPMVVGARPAKPAPSVASVASADPAVVAFQARLKEYLSLHRKLEAKLPKLSAKATPEQIDKHERELGALIQSSRPGAKQGEFFTPEMQRFLALVFERVFTGTDGKNLLGSIMDENPGVPKLAVNERYPDAVPLSTMPPDVLNVLPKLEEDMEYRFVGRRLVLFDAHGHIIVDFTDELLPAPG